jgi:predicted SAM-dependent methyltransferase
VLDHLFPNEIIPALSNWKKLLKVGGKLFVVVDDFEYISRAFVGGDISIEIVNEMHSHPTQFSRTYLVGLLRKAGFKEDKINIWLAEQVGDNKFPKEHYELVLESTLYE